MRAKPRARALMAPLMPDLQDEPLAPTPQILLDWWHSPAQRYIDDAFMDGLPLEQAMQRGKEEFERDMANGEAWIVDRIGLDEPQHRQRQVVYYMRMDRLVKIGTSRSLSYRISAINPQGVMAVEWGGLPLERERHKQFADLHDHGEWFHLREPLISHIVDLRAEFEKHEGRTTEQWLRLTGAVFD